jgi:hypothetical protein
VQNGGVCKQELPVRLPPNVYMHKAHNMCYTMYSTNKVIVRNNYNTKCLVIIADNCNAIITTTKKQHPTITKQSNGAKWWCVHAKAASTLATKRVHA